MRSPSNRRGFFSQVGAGIHGAALAWMLARERNARGEDEGQSIPAGTPASLAPRPPPLPAKARSVIHLFMNGGPSHMDLFDPKPALDRHHGEPYFDKIAGEVENIKGAGALLRSPFKFSRHGQSGLWLSEALPHLAGHADEIAVVRSMFTINLTHETALYLIQSGRALAGCPSVGSWVVYGLGSENQNLPAYVVLDDPLGLPINGLENWQAGFLPALYQGTRFRAKGDPVLNLRPQQDEPAQRTVVKRRLLNGLDELHRRAHPRQPALDARIASYELAARMQMSASDALDVSQEDPGTLALYGIGREPTDSYGRRCLMARRLVERGVRFVQLYINGQIWDNHDNLGPGLESACERTDLPIAGLLTDLRQRGLLDETLVLWGGEFGRLPIAQLPADRDEKKAGRDHNKNAFSSWMAGAGIKGGTTHGATDELGLAAVENRVSVADWHATILHLLGLRHDRLVFPRDGLEEKLTGVEGARVIDGFLA